MKARIARTGLAMATAAATLAAGATNGERRSGVLGTNLESGSIGEGFSDYLAVVVTSWTTGTPTRTPEACVADWDSVSYARSAPHCLRRLDGTKVYPQDVAGEVHADGEIWSRALWDIRSALGDKTASPR